MAWFLKVNGTKGESKQVAECMDVTNWQFGVNLPVSQVKQGSALAAGQSEVREMSVTVLTDKAALDLWKFTCGGKPVDEAVLVGRKDVSGKSKDFLKFTLKDVYVSHAKLAGSDANQSDDMVPNDLLLKFNKFKIEYTEYKKDGSPGDKPKLEFDAGKHEV
jgi:type VI protein secretion system component Hcp